MDESELKSMLEACETVCKALSDLPPEAQARVLKAAAILLGIDWNII